MALAVTLAVFLLCVHSTVSSSPTVEELEEQISILNDRLVEVNKILARLTLQTITQQFVGEEKVRSDGDSGIKLVRGDANGPQNYYTNSHHSGHSFASIHDHSNLKFTIGMGELIVVLNGVEFRTRHNDYKLVMPSTTSKEYHATEPIPFPGVPKEVSDKDTLEEQLEEMRQWFKAFKDQDNSTRDYTKYFKPVLCYLEGTWTLDEDLVEPFESDRHKLEASNWYELQQNMRYSAYTGTKDENENLAFLPTTIMAMDENGLPVYAQWNYRIVCKPLNRDIPTSYFKQVDDLAFRLPRKKSFEETFYSRGARFRLYDQDKAKFTKYTLLDELFATIPGKDNIPDELRENAFGQTMYEFGDGTKELNAGFYNRWFQFAEPGADGLSTVARGFNDENLFVAMTTQERVAPMYLKYCPKNGECQYLNHRVSYAIPLEIIYMTPLLSWNPLNIEIHNGKNIATAGGRTGEEDKPLLGADDVNYFITPADLFYGSTGETDPADTVKDAVYVMNKNGEKVVTAASGTRIILPGMGAVTGLVRQRYPIAPVHGEGSSVWKKLNALEDSVFSGAYGAFKKDGEDEEEFKNSLPEEIEFETSPARGPNKHFHTFTLKRQDYLDAMKPGGLQLRVKTSKADGHTHDLIIRYNSNRGLEYIRCDGEKVCSDRHSRKLLMVKDANQNKET